MKRSAAPSQKLAKQTKFVVPYANPQIERCKTPDETGSTTSSLKPKERYHNLDACYPTEYSSKLPSNQGDENKDSLPKQKSDPNEHVRPQKTIPTTHSKFRMPLLHKSSNNKVVSSAVGQSKDKPSHQQTVSSKNDMPTNNSQQDELQSIKRYFSVVWCKRSTKKHKKWEGDAVLIVNGRNVSLLDLEGKEIGKSSGYKLQELAELKDGETLSVGSKEIEVMGIIEEGIYLSGKCFAGNTVTAPQMITKTLSSALPKKKVMGASLFLDRADAQAATTRVLKPRFDSSAPGALVLSTPPAVVMPKDIKAVDVVVDPHISAHLRPHQREGVNFLYECVMGYKGLSGLGAILADEMGLGKTLQIIALVWTLLKQNPISHKPVVRRVLIVTPGSLVKNWLKEFKKWLGQERLNVFAVSSDKKAEEFKNAQVYPVMIVSYEMFVRYCETIKQSQFDLLVCDEGHRLKNSNIKTASMLQSVSTRRRIVVTGTPMQNDLKEFFALADFANPGILGTTGSFHKVYEEPILVSKRPNCTAEERRIGEERAQELNRLTSSFILRRTSDVNQQYLPQKTEYVVFCNPKPRQINLYKKVISSSQLNSLIYHSSDGNQHLVWINELKKICNYPGLLSAATDETTSASYNQEENHEENADHVDISTTGKLTVLAGMLTYLHRDTTDKIVLVSNYTKTLDILERLCKQEGYEFLRLDGQTPVQKRQQLVELFNSNYSKHTVFLLSSKAGGTGLNLIGANRLVLYDIDWNPANDLQAMARIWRDGQRKPVHIYRLLTTGTIEEKIYQRQVTKLALGDSVVDAVKESQVKFSPDDLRDLFTFRPDTECDTHDMLSCSCHQQSASNLTTQKKAQLQESSVAELNRWKHIPAVEIEVKLKDKLLIQAKDCVSYVFECTSQMKS